MIKKNLIMSDFIDLNAKIECLALKPQCEGDKELETSTDAEYIKQKNILSDVDSFFKRFICCNGKIELFIKHHGIANENIENLLHFITFLKYVYEKGMTTSPKRSRLMNEKILDITRDMDNINFGSIVLPSNNSDIGLIEIKEVISNSFFFHSSATFPLQFSVLLVERGVRRFLYKHGDDLRKDFILLSLARYIANTTDIKILTYSVFPFSMRDGFIEMIPCISMSQIHIIKNDTLSDLVFADVLNSQNFLESFVFFTIFSYLFGVGDRNQNNIVISNSGHFVHIDYSYVLGEDPKYFFLGGMPMFFFPSFMKRKIKSDAKYGSDLLEMFKDQFLRIYKRRDMILRQIREFNEKSEFSFTSSNRLCNFFTRRVLDSLKIEQQIFSYVENLFFAEMYDIKSDIIDGISTLSRFLRS